MDFSPAHFSQVTSHVSIWETHNRSRQQTAISIVCIVAGLALVVWLYGPIPRSSDAQAGFWFGMLLLVLGATTLVANARQIVIVDPLLREIRIEDRRVFGRRSRRIPFADVNEVEVAYLRTRKEIAIRYYLQLQLRGGEAYALFAPERVFSGASDPAVVTQWQARLKGLLETQTP